MAKSVEMHQIGHRGGADADFEGGHVLGREWYRSKGNFPYSNSASRSTSYPSMAELRTGWPGAKMQPEIYQFQMRAKLADGAVRAYFRVS